MIPAVVKMSLSIRTAESAVKRITGALQCLTTSSPVQCNASRNWIFIQGESKLELGMAFDEDRSIIARYQRILAIGSLLSRSSMGNRHFVSLDYPSINEFMEAEVFLNWAGVKERGFLAFNPGWEVSELPGKEDDLRSITRNFRIKIGLLIDPADVVHRFAQGPISVSEFLYLIYDSKQFCELVPSKEGVFRMKDGGIDATEFPVSVELGTIGLKAQELLSLRGGDVISIPCDDVTTGTLRVGDEAWARVKIEREPESLRLEVIEILIPEETSAEISR